MNTALNPLVQMLVWLIPIIVVVSILKSPWGKGQMGELFVRFMLRLRLDKTVYLPLHNVTLATLDGSTQIDHVLVSRFGIFSIETKNMQGWIFGSERQAEWTQKIYKRSFKFQNPLRQNYKHTQALESTLQVPPDTVHSVIVFVGGSTFKTDMPANVTYGGGCADYILSFTQPVFSDAQVQALLQRLQTGRMAPTRAHARPACAALERTQQPASHTQMSPVWQRPGVAHGQIRRRDWFPVLGLLDLSEVPGNAKTLTPDKAGRWKTCAHSDFSQRFF